MIELLEVYDLIFDVVLFDVDDLYMVILVIIGLLLELYDDVELMFVMFVVIDKLG